MPCDSVTSADIDAARRRIDGAMLRTATMPSPSPHRDRRRSRLSQDGASPDDRQLQAPRRDQCRTVAVRRGAPTRRRRLCRPAITVAALAYAAARAGVRAVICMSALVPENKVAAIRDLGAEVHIVGRSQDDAQEEVDRLVARGGLTMIPPFDHPAVIAGQGTLGLEMLEDVPERRDGSGAAFRRRADRRASRWRSRRDGRRSRIIGISMQRGAAMAESLAAGAPSMTGEADARRFARRRHRFRQSLHLRHGPRPRRDGRTA